MRLFNNKTFFKNFLAVSVLILEVGAQTDRLFIFSQSEKELEQCIENYLSYNNDSHLAEVSAIAKHVAVRFHGKIGYQSELLSNLRSLFTYLKLKKPELFRDDQTPTLLRLAMTEIIFKCAEDVFYGPLRIPTFSEEPPEISEVLNYILVDWTLPFYELAPKKNGQRLLKEYSKNAQTALNNALNFLGQYDHFREVIRGFWMHRSKFYFDTHDSRVNPSLRHFFTFSHRFPLVYLRESSLTSNQSHQNYVSEKMPQTVVDRFLDTHAADRPPYIENDMFSKYVHYGMTYLEYYIENHIDQFYRVILFANGFLLSDLGQDARNFNSNPLLYNVSKNKVQRLTFKDSSYRQLLLNARKFFEDISKKPNIEITIIFSNILDFFIKEHNKSMRKSQRIITITASHNLLISRIKQEGQEKSSNTYNADCDVIEYVDDYECSRSNTYTETNLQVNPTSVPDFFNEPIEVVLDYVLVDWPTSLQNMIRTRDGRALLRRYAEDAQSHLESALQSTMSHDHFRYSVRSLWMFRAQRYFDGYDTQLPYLRQRFSMEHPYPHTYDDQYLFTHQLLSNLSDRNPQISPEAANRVLNIHAKDHMYCNEEYDIFSLYEQNGMTSAQYYIETHIDQFYRILFFFMELELYGIKSDEDDIWDGPLPYEAVPDFIQEIVYNDDSYRNFLLLERRRLIRSSNKVEIGRGLLSARVGEEDLFSVLKIILNSMMPDQTTSTTSSTTEASSSRSSTTLTLDYQLKRKGSVWKNNEGKHFSKRPKSTFLESCCNIDDHDSYSEDCSKNTESCLLERCNYTIINSADHVFFTCSIRRELDRKKQQLQTNEGFYGYILNFGPNQLHKFEIEWSTYSKVVSKIRQYEKNNVFQDRTFTIQKDCDR